MPWNKRHSTTLLKNKFYSMHQNDNLLSWLFRIPCGRNKFIGVSLIFWPYSNSLSNICNYETKWCCNLVIFNNFPFISENKTKFICVFIKCIYKLKIVTQDYYVIYFMIKVYCSLLHKCFKWFIFQLFIFLFHFLIISYFTYIICWSFQ